MSGFCYMWLKAKNKNMKQFFLIIKPEEQSDIGRMELSLGILMTEKQ